MGTDRIFHIADPDLWQRALADGSYAESTRDATLRTVGFIHCSYRAQVEQVANFIYADWPGALILLEIDTSLVDAPIRAEQVNGASDRFPHIYGPLPCDAVVGVHPLQRYAERWQLPGDIPEPSCDTRATNGCRAKR